MSRKQTEERDFNSIGLPEDFEAIPIYIQADPYKYSNDPNWKGLDDYLGYFRPADRLRQYKTFKEAKALVHSKNLKTSVHHFSGTIN